MIAPSLGAMAPTWARPAAARLAELTGYALCAVAGASVAAGDPLPASASLGLIGLGALLTSHRLKDGDTTMDLENFRTKAAALMRQADDLRAAGMNAAACTLFAEAAELLERAAIELEDEQVAVLRLQRQIEDRAAAASEARDACIAQAARAQRERAQRERAA